MSTPSRRSVRWMLVFLMALPVSGAAGSEPVEDFDTEVAEQEGAVYGRLRHLEGVLTIRRGSDVLGDLVPNEPIAPGDTVVTGSDARGEIQLADGSVVRVDRDSEVVLQSLPDGTGQLENTTILQLARGSLLVFAESMDSSDKRFQIDTDTMSAFLLSDGIFRVDVEPGVTWVRSRRGAAEVMSNEASAMLRSGERVVVRAGEMPGEAHAVNTRLGDEFDAWSDERDNVMVRAVPHDEVEPEVLPEPVRPYAAELSYYGNWQNTPSYGWVWSPAGLASTWRPYTYGRWSWSPAGMVWVSHEPWGWAPFHYGRWEYVVGPGWVWIPGYTFSGAHVAWSVSPGYFGWCPLGYYDYPVSYGVNFGWHHDPWVYVRADRIYVRRVHTVMVRDAHVVRQIRGHSVVVRGHPRIRPNRAAAGPAFSEELHRNFTRRPDLQLRQPDGNDRRVAFRDTERQRLMRIAGRPGPGSGNVRPGRSARAAAPSGDPTVSMPRSRAVQPERPGVRAQTGARPSVGGVISGRPVRREVAVREPATSTPRRVAPQSPQPTTGQGVRREAPPRRGSPATPTLRGQTQRPGGSQAQNQRPSQPQARSQQRPAQGQTPRAEPRRATGSAPERVIPRMIPRSRTEAPRSAPPSARPSSPAPRPSPARAQSAPPSRPSAPARSSGSVRGHSGGGKDKGKKGKN